MRRHLELLVALASAAVITAAQERPVFRTGVEVIQLDVSVLDKDRRPVRGLTAHDFTIFEDGKPQKVLAFNAIDIPDLPPAPATVSRTGTRAAGRVSGVGAREQLPSMALGGYWIGAAL